MTAILTRFVSILGKMLCKLRSSHNTLPYSRRRPGVEPLWRPEVSRLHAGMVAEAV